MTADPNRRGGTREFNRSDHLGMTIFLGGGMTMRDGSGRLGRGAERRVNRI